MVSVTEKMCIDSFFKGLKPPSEMTVNEWADKYRVLPKESSDESGQWRTSRTPYLKELMKTLSPSHPAEDIVFMKGSQVGATECGINWALFSIHLDPGPMLVVQPTLEGAALWSTQRFSPSIAMCEPVSELVADNKSRGASNKILLKSFPGGILRIAGANSAASLRQMPVEKLFLDEIDGYPYDVDGEGDSLELAKRRTTNFPRRKRLYTSTPTIQGMSRIETLFKHSDQRYYYIPCPHCNETQIMKWGNIKFKNRDPETVYLECAFCSGKIHEHHKTWMLENGEWVKHKPKIKIPGFHLSGLYSPLGWYSWENAVEDHIKALGNPLLRKVFVNTVLAETFDPAAETINASWLMSRSEEYTTDVPIGPVVLTAGVDIQADRIECTVWGWGGNDESWVICHDVFRGDPGCRAVWDLLDIHILKTFEVETGDQLNISCTCIDSGYSTDNVYKFCREREYRRVFAIKGMSGTGRPISGRGTLQKKHRCHLFIVGVDQAKTLIYGRLKMAKPGAGYIHFPKSFNEEYYKQLTAERCVKKLSTGLPKLVWELGAGRRNEALDCAVYALAALMILNPNIDLLVKENVLLKLSTKRPVLKKRGVRSAGQ